jgi:predicted nucleic acid-binding protein
MNLLDTDAVIELLRERRYEAGVISVVTLIEILRGIEDEKRTEIKGLLEQSFDIMKLNNEVITTYCALYDKLREIGEAIPDADLLIAATAISHNLSLKTGDKHFERLRAYGLSIINL